MLRARLERTKWRRLEALQGLLPFMARRRWQFVQAAIALLLAAGAALVLPYAARRMIDAGLGRPSPDAGLFIDGSTATFLALLGVALVLGLATGARLYLVQRAGELVVADLRKAVYRHVLRQSPEFFESARTGEVLSRLTADTLLIQLLIGTSLSIATRNLVLLLGGTIVLFMTSPMLTGVILALLVVGSVPMAALGRRARALSRDTQLRVADTAAVAAEVLNAMPTVQAFTREPAELRRYADATDLAMSTSLRRIRFRALINTWAIVLSACAIVFVLWLGSSQVAQGRMSAGTLGQFILYAMIVGSAVSALSEVAGDFQRAAGAAERLLELLALRSPVASALAPRPLAGPAGRGAAVSLSGVVFHYPSRPLEPALARLDLKIAAGETIAIVGSSGAGKSTLFQLLLRFYDPRHGAIEFDGVDLRDLDLQALRRSIGVVLQETVIFSTSVMENIRYGREDASDEEVLQAAALAAAHEFIERLPEGYQTFLGERGVRLSGGQRQRIAIARALLKNPRLMLLDEATSALDAESERLVQQALDTAMRGRTTLVIAHRLATVKQASRILVMEHGRVVETGTHASLMALGGRYARQAALQFQPGPEDKALTGPCM
ncbi:ABC transporter [Roseateles aquatilis]|uniref:ABC transporter n=1 Tax=Roseateles aquatilis TaxID=431061 RepID=A0A246JDT4_9BURK|nr:ABC transporter transmembrane domain-containing protein [Roseateles aquatilis]OWQ90657.1 ABC transporter [Roseateles aquatilis]